jgi:hypothetical protein
MLHTMSVPSTVSQEAEMRLMFLTGRDAGTVHIVIGRIVSSLSARQRNLEGLAMLNLFGGDTISVKATITLATSAFSTRGEGHFYCPEKAGLDALASDEWLALAFPGENPVMVAVSAIKTSADQCRCLFEVKS